MGCLTSQQDHTSTPVIFLSFYIIFWACTSWFRKRWTVDKAGKTGKRFGKPPAGQWRWVGNEPDYPLHGHVSKPVNKKCFNFPLNDNVSLRNESLPWKNVLRQKQDVWSDTNPMVMITVFQLKISFLLSIKSSLFHKQPKTSHRSFI